MHVYVYTIKYNLCYVCVCRRLNQQQQYNVGFLPVPGLHLTAPPPAQYPTVSHPQTYTQTHRNSLSVARSHAHLAHTANFLAKRPSLQDPPLEVNLVYCTNLYVVFVIFFFNFVT